MSGKSDRRPVTIHQLDAAGGAVVNSWRLDGAWPCRWSWPSFNASGNDVAIEELELAYDDLVWLPAPDKPARDKPARDRRARDRPQPEGPSSSPARARARKKTEGA